MAAAARPGPSDARVPCALCGGLIHPIAGKCKHCKADLTAHQAARPPAAAPLPALRAASPQGQVHWYGKPATPAQAPGLGAPAADRAAPAVHLAPPAGQSVGHPAGPAGKPYDPHAHAAVPLDARRDPSRPVLPPRPTNRGYAADPEARGWRSWPVVVIALAMVAIVVAVVLMVWPVSRHDGEGKRQGVLPPAPERMQTEPDVSSPSTPPHAPAPTAPAPQPPAPPPATPPDRDPWADPSDPSPSAAPPARAPQAPTHPDPGDRDDDDASIDSLPADPLANRAPRTPPAGRRRLRLNGNGVIMLTMAEHLCRKIVQCGSANPSVATMCEELARQSPAMPRNCPAAARCLAHIDTMSCAAQNGDISQLTVLMNRFVDCSDATRC